MKIMVTFKRVPDPASTAPGENQWLVNPFDAIAIEEACRIRERGEATEVVGVTIGAPPADEQARTALAMGIDRAIRVDDARSLDPFAVAALLEAVVKRENPDLVLMGKQAVDDDSNQVGQMLAGRLGWAQATFISKLTLPEGGTHALCVRETDRGLETLQVRLPAVVTADLRLNEPRYVSLPGLMKARRKPIEVLSSASLPTRVEPQTVVMQTVFPPKRPAGARVASLEELLAALQDRDKVLR